MPQRLKDCPERPRGYMRFLGVGDYCDLGSLYLRLLAEGHEVKIAKPLCQGTLAGMVQRVDDWEAELAWIRQANKEGIILFEVARLIK
jgi:phosphoribosylamine--glycine ligase